MADQQRWWKMWCSILTDDDILKLPPADRWAWVALATYTKEHGTRGTISIYPENAALAMIFDVPKTDVLAVLKRLPHVTIEEGKPDNGKLTVTFHNWYKYQEDSTVYERVRRLRSKRRGEESKNKRRKETPRDPHDPFEHWWDAYPKKVGKGDARRAWVKLVPSVELQRRMLQAVADQKTWPQWVKDGGQFIPHPATWLNGHRWEDQAPSEAAFPHEERPTQRSVADDLTPLQRQRLKALTTSIGKAT